MSSANLEATDAEILVAYCKAKPGTASHVPGTPEPKAADFSLSDEDFSRRVLGLINLRLMRGGRVGAGGQTGPAPVSPNITQDGEAWVAGYLG